MKMINFFKDPAHLLLSLFCVFFIGLPFVEAQQIEFALTPFLYSVVILLALFLAALPAKLFFQCLLFLFLSFFLDMILLITLNPMLERVIRVTTYVLYIGLCLISLGFLIRRMLAVAQSHFQRMKIGMSIYLLMGFLWSLFYSVIFIFDRRAFSTLMLDQFPFFQFSFSTVTRLQFTELIPLSPLAVNMASAQVLCGQIFLAVWIATMVGFYVVEQIQR